MKRIIFIGLCLVFLTGCGSGNSKKLNCTHKGITDKTEFNVVFDKKGERVESYTLTVIHSHGDGHNIDNEYQNALGYCAHVKQGFGSEMSCKVSENGEELIVTTSVTISQLSEKQISELNVELGSYEKVKKSLESQGAVCK